jgi:dephospho-CoA kinase
MTGPVIIGLAGGIGSGKSTVACVFEALGCMVIDSDKLSKEAMTRDDVRETLRQWWGDEVLAADGQVDRRAVAKIVFSDPKERERLEGLIHPLIARARAERIEDARNAGVLAVVVDAPLLFEAGLDKEVDAVVFVDCPFETRLERVKTGRGWDERELRLREKAQLGVEQKRRRSDYEVVNMGGPDDLRRQVSQILTRITEATERD